MSPLFQTNLSNSHRRLDLYELVTFHKEATFYARYEGNDLEGLGIKNHDILVIDRSIKPENGRVIVLIEDDEFKVEKLSKVKSREVTVWGVVTFVIHKV